MSVRTWESDKAIQKAWKEEQSLIQRGLGTRDWTPEQQKDILTKGKAYDDMGKAFEGHHKKSVVQYPEYQGYVDNIQFLSRAEHIKAHGGSTQNPTNGYYSYITGRTTDYGNNPPKKRRTIKLSSPIHCGSSDDSLNDFNKTSSANESLENSFENANKACVAGIKISIADNELPQAKKKSIIDWIRDGVRTIANHPMARTIGNAVVSAVAEEVPNLVGEIIDESVQNHINKATSRETEEYQAFSEHDVRFDENSDVNMRSSPKEHNVSGHWQLYHTKEGDVMKYKEPYERGGKGIESDESI